MSNQEICNDTCEILKKKKTKKAKTNPKTKKKKTIRQLELQVPKAKITTLKTSLKCFQNCRRSHTMFLFVCLFVCFAIFRAHQPFIMTTSLQNIRS